MITWRWLTFDALTLNQLYEMMALRQQVFVIEQNCPYLDADGLDQHSWHLLGLDEGGQLLAYLRLIAPGYKYAEPSIGRVLTRPDARGKGFGRRLMIEGIEGAARLFPKQAIRISAQQYLENFYAELGFRAVGELYEEEGIPHREMFLPPARTDETSDIDDEKPQH